MFINHNCQDNDFYYIFASLISGGAICRGRNAEESPDRAGHPAAESAGGGNFTPAVTEKNRRTSLSGRPSAARVKTRGKSSRRVAAM